MTAIQKAREALDEARKFIATEHADAPEAMPVFDMIWHALAALDAETPANRAAQAERMARMEEALTKRIEWHTCSCPEPCDDYWVFPGGCIGKYREDYHSLRALSQEESEPS